MCCIATTTSFMNITMRFKGKTFPSKPTCYTCWKSLVYGLLTQIENGSESQKGQRTSGTEIKVILPYYLSFLAVK